MRRKSKKIILLIGCIVAIVLLTQCELVKVYLSQALFPAEVVPFPMEEGKTVSYTVDSWAEKRYAISLKTEYRNEAAINQEERMKIPYNISINCYYLQNGQEILIYKDRRSDKTDEFHWFDGGNGWELIHPHNPDSVGRSNIRGGFDAPYGKYRCDFKDESSPEIKVHLQASGIVATYLEISPYIALFY